MPLDVDAAAAAVEELVNGDDAGMVMTFELACSRLFDIDDLFHMNMRRMRRKWVVVVHPGLRVRYDDIGDPDNVLPPAPPLADCRRRCRFMELECAQDTLVGSNAVGGVDRDASTLMMPCADGIECALVLVWSWLHAALHACRTELDCACLGGDGMSPAKSLPARRDRSLETMSQQILNFDGQTSTCRKSI